MNDAPLNGSIGNLDATTDRTRIDAVVALRLLRQTHWAADMSADQLQCAIDNSLVFAVFDNRKMVAFARAITDGATFAYLTDVVVARRLRGQGLGGQFIRWMLQHPDLRGLRRIMLLTRDAERFYLGLGFISGSSLTLMEKL